MQDDPTVPGAEFAGRYTIERELGRGGAAIVYLARDTRQERQVALKVLHRELAQAIGAQRFLREIKHSSALHHPHLLSIHDSGEFNGLLYFVMPYMRDGSLRTRIAKEKQLAMDEALRITRDVGEALAYAHSQGIVHRDIKPDNVLFSAEHACLADFGIARAVDSAAADTLTSTGLVVGTPAYMSPEQASGEKKVDTRSDQYSLACLLYEMVTGLPPFIGATQQAVISQRFTQPPPSMRGHRPSVPDHVDRAVKRALAVVPADRFPSVGDFIAALHEPGAVAEPVSVHSIKRRWFAVGAAAAVVTLAVVAAKPGVEWVRGAFGPQVDTSRFVVLPFLSEEDPALGKRVASGVHSALSEWVGLGIESDAGVRDAVAGAGGEIGSLTQAIAIARALGAGRLVWGTVTSESAQARVVANVYDVERSTELAKQTNSIPVAAMTDSAFRALANGLLRTGPLPDASDDGSGGTKLYPALQAYRRGVVALGRFELESANADLVRAVELDPDFAVAHLELARVQSWLDPDRKATWQASARRAVALREELNQRDAIRAAALLAYAQEDYPTACARYRELLQRDTLDALAWHGLGECLHADDAVVRDTRSRSGFRFRSSWHAAGSALVRALEIEPKLHAIPHFRRLGRVFPTAHNQIRTGVGIGSDAREFGARPSLDADTLAHMPYPGPDFEKERDLAHRALRLRALERNRRVMLELTDTWTRTYPHSSEAHTARASIFEVRGDFGGASASLRTALGYARTPLERLLLADAKARVRLKAHDFATARLVADSALLAFEETTEENWEAIARLAGLTGKSGRLATALQYFWPRYARADDLHQAVSRAAGHALADAVVGICNARPPEVQRSLGDLIRIHAPPERHAVLTDRVVGTVLSFSVPCASGPALGRVRGMESIVGAQQAFAAGNARLARAILNSVERGRSELRAADVSPMLVTREAALLLAMGDTTAAIARIDGTLDGLSSMSASTLRYPLEYAILVRMMATRADLAAATGDIGQARKWSQVVAILWARADPALKPTIDTMQKRAR
ncbi:MAG: protein kinase domain-containing protein [Gemmatimonadaceae bacterium]